MTKVLWLDFNLHSCASKNTTKPIVQLRWTSYDLECELAHDVKLTFAKERFDPAGKAIEVSDNNVLSIDGGIVFGTDGEMPRTYLKKGTLTIGSATYELQVDGMYNPWHDDYFNEKTFRVLRDGAQYRIQGGFSDGAGYYGVEWIVLGKGCTRTILTNDEKILFEYFEN